MDIVILATHNLPSLVENYFKIAGKSLVVSYVETDGYTEIMKDHALSIEKNGWNFLCLNLKHCFEDQFAVHLKKLSQNQTLYMFAINPLADGLWFEQYQNGVMKRQWIEVEGVIEGNMGEKYLPEEERLGYPFVDESYEDVEQEMIFELIYEITGYDITEIL